MTEKEEEERLCGLPLIRLKNTEQLTRRKQQQQYGAGRPGDRESSDIEWDEPETIGYHRLPGRGPWPAQRAAD